MKNFKTTHPEKPLSHTKTLTKVFFDTSHIPMITFQKKNPESSVKSNELIFWKIDFLNFSVANLKT